MNVTVKFVGMIQRSMWRSFPPGVSTTQITDQLARRLTVGAHRRGFAPGAFGSPRLEGGLGDYASVPRASLPSLRQLTAGDVGGARSGGDELLDLLDLDVHSVQEILGLFWDRHAHRGQRGQVSHDPLLESLSKDSSSRRAREWVIGHRWVGGRRWDGGHRWVSGRRWLLLSELGETLHQQAHRVNVFTYQLMAGPARAAAPEMMSPDTAGAPAPLCAAVQSLPTGRPMPVAATRPPA